MKLYDSFSRVANLIMKNWNPKPNCRLSPLNSINAQSFFCPSCFPIFFVHHHKHTIAISATSILSIYEHFITSWVLIITSPVYLIHSISGLENSAVHSFAYSRSSSRFHFDSLQFVWKILSSMEFLFLYKQDSVQSIHYRVSSVVHISIVWCVFTVQITKK